MVIEDREEEYEERGGGRGRGSKVHVIGLKGDKYRSREGYFVILNSF